MEMDARTGERVGDDSCCARALGLEGGRGLRPIIFVMADFQTFR